MLLAVLLFMVPGLLGALVAWMSWRAVSTKTEATVAIAIAAMAGLTTIGICELNAVRLGR